MNVRSFGILATAAFAAGAASAQSFSRQAVLVGGGGDVGKCTIEVVVDGAAQVEIRGGNAILKNLSGQPPQWRRFECTSIMPANPVDFRFAGVDGRGRQQLIADPRNGGAAVVRIDDPDNGSEGYTFDLTWRNGGYPTSQGERPNQGGVPYGNARPNYGGRPPVDEDIYHRDRDGYFRGNGFQPQFFQRIREDLNHVAALTPPFGGDQARLERTNFELDELQQKLSRGFYDERELDEVMAALRVVVQNNRLTGRDRAILNDDLNRMRDFRMRHDEYGARDQENVYHQERDQYFRGESWRANFFQRIREDLDHVSTDTVPFGGDQARLSRTKFELDELQQKLGRGYYDQVELDEVMGALQTVLNSNRLSPRDRDVLADDLSRMRDFRNRHEQYGAR